MNYEIPITDENIEDLASLMDISFDEAKELEKKLIMETEE